MAPRPPLANCARVAMSLVTTDESGGHVAVNGFYVNTYPGGTSETNLTVIANGVHAAWVNFIAPEMSADYSLTQVTATAVDGTEAQGVNSTVAGATLEGVQISPSTCACISWPIPAAYRGGHPRNYHPGIVPAQLVAPGSNLMSVSTAESLAVAYNNFSLAVDAIVAGPGVIAMGTISYVRGNAPRAVPVFYGYGNPKVNTRLATQRRRLGKLSVGNYEV
jgi:hypothetical protein